MQLLDTQATEDRERARVLSQWIYDYDVDLVLVQFSDREGAATEAAVRQLPTDQQQRIWLLKPGVYAKQSPGEIVPLGDYSQRQLNGEDHI